MSDLEKAISRLADMFEGGHLLASMMPAVLLGLVADELERRGELVDDAVSWIMAARNEHSELLVPSWVLEINLNESGADQ